MSFVLPQGLRTLPMAKTLSITFQRQPLNSYSVIAAWQFWCNGLFLGNSVVRRGGNSVLWDHRGEFVIEDYLRGDRQETGLILAWLRNMIPDTFGVWFTDEYCYLPQAKPVRWSRQHHFSSKLAFPHVLMPDRRINQPQLITIGHWMNDTFDPCCWDHVGCTIAFKTEGVEAMFLLRWQDEIIEPQPNW